MSELREMLFAAVAARDAERLAALCNEHVYEILEQFGTWTTLPEPLRDDMAAAERWVTALHMIARFLEAMGCPGPLESIAGDTSDNPIVQWSDQFSHASRLHETGQHLASIGVLNELFVDIEGTRGPFIDDLITKMHGLLGTNHHSLGDRERARTHTQLALDSARRAGDAQGVRIYEENLRVFGVSEAGREADWTQRIADAQDLSDAAHYEASNRVLEDTLAEIGADAAFEHRAKLFGLLGLNAMRLGDAERARLWTEQAVLACESAQDAFGVTVYRQNLSVISGTPPPPHEPEPEPRRWWRGPGPRRS